MNYIKNGLLLLTAVLSFGSIAQIGGNQVYGNNSYGYTNNSNYNTVQKRTITSTDSTLIITTSILMNKLADHYLISVGTNQEAKTVLECNTKINTRINKLIKDLAGLEVEKDDVYVDFISQTKVYDYEVEQNQSKQLETGFEIKKNIIIQLDDIDKMDALVELCAKQQIYDIIKVEYVDSDINQSYEKMYTEALNFIESRKSLFMKSSSQKMSGAKRVIGDNFYSVYPKTQYKKYEAYESSSLSVHSKNYASHYVQQEARKNKTFYYDGIQTSGFDKIINASKPDIGIQYVMTLTMIYELN